MRAQLLSVGTRLRSGEGLLGRFARGAQWNTLAVGFTVGASFLGSIIFARILGQKAFGAYGIVNTTLMTAVALSSQFGGGAVNRYVSQYRWNDKPRTGRIIGLNLIAAAALSLTLAVTLAVFSRPIAEHVMHAPHLASALLVASAIVPLMTINGVNLGALAGFEAFPTTAAIAGIGCVAYLAAGATGAWMFGIPGALLGSLTGYGMQTIVSYWMLTRVAKENGVRVTYHDVKIESASLLRFNLPAMLGAITPMTALALGQVLLVRRANGFNDMALYSASYTLRSGVVLLPYVLYAVTVSMINSYQAVGDTERQRRLFWLNVYTTVAMAVGVASVAALAAPFVLSAFGNAFVKGESILIILLVGAIFEATLAAVYQVIQARELLWQSLFFVVLPRDLTIGALSVLLVPAHGATGLAISYVAGWAVALTTTTLIVARAGIVPPTTAPKPAVPA
jgi:O-antigen/teichoic acid export membrane protein